MKLDSFSLREAEIFRALKALQGNEFVVIGGYAVNAYALPRFSIDCDIVVKSEAKASQIKKILEKQGYSVMEKQATEGNYGGSFLRLDKTVEKGFKVSFDVLVGEVTDRRTNASFSAEWVFTHSNKKRLKGKTVIGSLELRVINADALTVMKLVASRKADLRDVFMLLPLVKNLGFVKSEVSKKTGFSEAVERAGKTILSKEFKNNLQGVFGYLDEKAFRKSVKAFEELKAQS